MNGNPPEPAAPPSGPSIWDILNAQQGGGNDIRYNPSTGTFETVSSATATTPYMDMGGGWQGQGFQANGQVDPNASFTSGQALPEDWY
jgi:hypothetical protein